MGPISMEMMLDNLFLEDFISEVVVDKSNISNQHGYKKKDKDAPNIDLKWKQYTVAVGAELYFMGNSSRYTPLEAKDKITMFKSAENNYPVCIRFEKNGNRVGDVSNETCGLYSKIVPRWLPGYPKK
jgi:hypothetical protein